MSRLKNQVCMVTGAARGIGKAIVALFIKEGAKVVLVDQDDEGLKVAETLSENGAEILFIQADVSNTTDVQNMVTKTIERFDRIDVLVNNAGISGGMDNGLEVDEALWKKVIDINLTGVYLCTKYVGQHMKDQKSGSIVNMSSMLGIIGSPFSTPYHASKGGVRTFTKAMAIVLAPYGVRINSIHPGYIDTEMVRMVFEDLDDPEARAGAEAAHPLGRLGTPEEVAYAALFLACHESSFITGTELMVDGGFTAQ